MNLSLGSYDFDDVQRAHHGDGMPCLVWLLESRVQDRPNGSNHEQYETSRAVEAKGVDMGECTTQTSQHDATLSNLQTTQIDRKKMHSVLLLRNCRQRQKALSDCSSAKVSKCNLNETRRTCLQFARLSALLCFASFQSTLLRMVKMLATLLRLCSRSACLPKHLHQCSKVLTCCSLGRPTLSCASSDPRRTTTTEKDYLHATCPWLQRLPFSGMPSRPVNCASRFTPKRATRGLGR